MVRAAVIRLLDNGASLLSAGYRSTYLSKKVFERILRNGEFCTGEAHHVPTCCGALGDSESIGPDYRDYVHGFNARASREDGMQTMRDCNLKIRMEKKRTYQVHAIKLCAAVFASGDGSEMTETTQSRICAVSSTAYGCHRRYECDLNGFVDAGVRCLQGDRLPVHPSGASNGTSPGAEQVRRSSAHSVAHTCRISRAGKVCGKSVGPVAAHLKVTL